MDVKLYLAAGLAFAITALLAPSGIPLLRRLKFGQSIRADGPTWHKSKQGTPTMGGLFFIGGILAATLIFASAYYMGGDMRPVLALMAALAFGFIGFIDDYIKVVMKRNLGLTARQKFALQLLVAAVLLLSLRLTNYTDTAVHIPFTNAVLELGYFYYPLALLFITGTVNSVNLTDGLDGLATSVTIPVAIFFVWLSVFFHSPGIGVFASALAGGLLGFLIYNAHPAKVFMGDTGSLFLGGALSALAFCFNMPLILVVAGLIYYVETASVMLQVIYFKATKGKRLFKMSPLHHHFEMSGWKETKVVWVFSGLTVAFSLLSVIAVLSYYRM